MLLRSVAQNTGRVVSILADDLLDKIRGQLCFWIRSKIRLLRSLSSFILKLNRDRLLSVIVEVL